MKSTYSSTKPPKICRSRVRHGRSWVAQSVHNSGCRVVTVGDGIYNPAELGIPAVVAYRQAEGTVAGFPSSDDITNRELLRLECEIPVPTAIETVINDENARYVKAPLILKAANHPITPEADNILSASGRIILPDILVNAGGVIVSCIE